jgi:hypothetical protein
MRFIQLLLQFSRVQWDFLEARLRPVEQLDKWTPRGMSGLGANHHGRVNDSLLKGTSGHLTWLMRWTLPNTGAMRQNRIFNETIYIGNVQDKA